MNVVDVTHDHAGAQPPQEVRLLEPSVDVGHAGLDELAELELMAVLGDLQGAELARPVVDVLEEMPVNGAKVVKVEGADRDAFREALRNEPSLDLVQSF